MSIHKKSLKLFITFVTVPLIAVMAALSASAHWDCVHTGHYYNNMHNDLVFYVKTDVITSSASYSDISNYLGKWNGISSSVHVSTLGPVPGMANQNDKNTIEYGNLPGDITGRTIFYNSSGTTISPNSHNIHNVKIEIDVVYLNTQDNPIQQTKKTIIHEVGHALLLYHPVNDQSLAYHNFPVLQNTTPPVYYWLPYSVMNQGSVDLSHVSTTPASHDIFEMHFKWGY